MKIINILFGIPLGYIMYFCYSVTGSYGWAIILFTLLSKAILFPISLSVQKNSVKMAKMKPQLDEITTRYAGDKDKIAEEQMALYKKEKYSPAKGCIPTLLQLPLILGLLDVIYNPFQHLLHLGSETIAALTAGALQIFGVDTLGSGAQLQIANAVRQMPAAFEGLRHSIEDFDAAISAIGAIDFNFFGIDLSAVPSLRSFSILLLIPLLSALSTLIMCVSQNYMNVLQKEQGALNKWGITIFLTAFSTYFAFVVPAGVGLYWVAGNLLSIVVMLLCNILYDPRKFIDYQNRPQKPKLTKEEQAAQRAKNKANRNKEIEDNKRFYSDDNNKELVFYSAAGGFYKYFSRMIDYVTQNSDIVVHYVTGDAEDKIFKTANPQIVPYYIGDKALIPFMMKMDASMVVMTMPDLQQYHIKRSLVRKDVEYIYTNHAMASFHMQLREGALDYYDTIFCYGQHHMDEVRATEKFYQLPAKKLVKAGYGLLDTLLEQVGDLPRQESAVKKILIAPSWQQDNIFELCLDKVLEQLVGREYCVIIRPHPEFTKRFPAKMEKIRAQYAAQLGDRFMIDTDFFSNQSIFTADLLITDWSGIAQEFSYSTQKPSLFINTPVKVMNPEYWRINITPLEFSLRDKAGVSLDIDQLDKLYDCAKELLSNPEKYRAQIQAFMEENLFYIGDNGKAAGEYIIRTLQEKRRTPASE